MNQLSPAILRPKAIEHINSLDILGTVNNSIYTSKELYKIPDDTPITASLCKGAYQSLFKDDIWFISEMHQINFKTGVDGLTENDILEVKTLSYLFLEIPFARNDGLFQKRLAPKTALLRSLTLKSLKKTKTLENKSLISLFTDINVSDKLAKEILHAERNKLPNYSTIISNLQGIIGQINALSQDYLNIEPVKPIALSETLHAVYTRSRSVSEQHTVIPPVIYSQIYQDAIEIVHSWNFAQFEMDTKNLISAYSNLEDTGSNSNKAAGVSRKSYQNRLDAFLSHEERFYIRPGNDRYFKDKIKSVGQVESISFFYDTKNITGITYKVRRLQAFLARLILLETTMRENELIGLLNEPIKSLRTQKGTVFAIQGKETKITGGNRECWVVSKNAKVAHDILRQLSDFSYLIHIIETSKPKWLFPKLTCAIVDRSDNHRAGEWTAPNGRKTFYKIVDDKPIDITSLFQYKDMNRDNKWFDRTGEYILSSADVNFLQTYGSNSNRLNVNVQPEQVFSVTEHQFRRSLPFYASAADLLSISDLKYQLKHLAIVTTYYYADGGIALKESGLLLDDNTYEDLNKNIIKDREHADIILRKELMSTLEDSRKTLFGPGLVAVQHFTKNINMSTDPEKEWSDLSKEGAIKTKQLPHGHCITTQPCDDFANNNFSQCFNCANGVLDKEKVITLIKKTKEQANSAKNEFNKSIFIRLAEKLENAALTTQSKHFKGEL